MLAPVVPIRLASTAPTARKPVLMTGVACRSPRSTIPPEIVNSAPSSMMKETYSSPVCPSSAGSRIAT